MLGRVFFWPIMNGADLKWEVFPQFSFGLDWGDRIPGRERRGIGMDDKKTSWLYKVIRWLGRSFYPKIRIVGEEKLPEGPAIIVGNHAQMNGPIVSELYIPGKHYIWCAGQMMHLKDVPAYAYQDFWSRKPKAIRWFYKLLSYVIAPLSVCVFNNAHTIGVYHDARIMSTFKKTVARLQEGARVVIFPEHDVPHDHIVCEFQDKFVDVAKLYHRRTGEELAFVPMYIAPALKTVYFGEPVRFRASDPAGQERRRICDHLMAQITKIACSLPEHTVVPYQNIPKKHYPSNIPKEGSYEKAGRRLPNVSSVEDP